MPSHIQEAKLSRQQVEKESLEVLQNLIHCGIPKAIESNLKAFEKLISDMTGIFIITW